MLKRALEELDSEVVAYRKLSDMLDEQFQTAKRLDTAMLAKISAEIAREVSCLDERRRSRTQWLGPVPESAGHLHGSREGAAHDAVERRCAELKMLAAQCKASTLRNGQLLASQYDMMQRILHGEQPTYGPY